MTTTDRAPVPFGRRAPTRVRGGSASVFTEAYRTLAPLVRGYLQARGVEDVDAATQDVFVSLLPRLEAFEGTEAGLRSLVFTIAHARAVDHHRTRGRRPLIIAYDPDEDNRTTPSAEEHALEEQSGVLALLPRLHPEHREVLALRIVADLSQEATAEIMGRSVGAIKQLQRRALLALRAELNRTQEVLA
ncbi:RNA polymerase sigma factor [Amnibacterium sp.]|uniref:RNA polymerase sigma factor n=1 Tax=Amnibacterium sp. TaxID=1872496 RepID=UPI003F7C74A1